MAGKRAQRLGPPRATRAAQRARRRLSALAGSVAVSQTATDRLAATCDAIRSVAAGGLTPAQEHRLDQWLTQGRELAKSVLASQGRTRGTAPTHHHRSDHESGPSRSRAG